MVGPSSLTIRITSFIRGYSNPKCTAGSTITQDVPAQALGIARERQTNLEGWAEPKMEAYIAKKQKLEADQNK